jgi:hypothetical protein
LRKRKFDKKETSRRFLRERAWTVLRRSIPQTTNVFPDPARNAEWISVYNPEMAGVAQDVLQNAFRVGENETMKNWAGIIERITFSGLKA